MSKKILEGFLIVLAFALLWVPLGQQNFLYEHWMKLGIFMMPFLAFLAISFEPKFGSFRKPDPKLIALILLCIYIVHQFEEH